MMIRVIYRDQSAGVIESHLLDELINKGRIVAYHSVDRWVPVEPRKDFHGEKRVKMSLHRNYSRKFYSH
mgnify:CR=1 FL=1